MRHPPAFEHSAFGCGLGLDAWRASKVTGQRLGKMQNGPGGWVAVGRAGVSSFDGNVEFRTPMKLQIAGRRVRRWRSVSEKLQIAQTTMEPGVRVAEVARTRGLNASEIFTRRRAFERGELTEPCATLLPVRIESPNVKSLQWFSSHRAA